MYELIKAGPSTYYMDCPSRSGIYLVDTEHICIIDGGSDKNSAKKLSSHIDSLNFKPIMLLNTHCHADHDGGNAYLQEKYNCPVYCFGADAALIQNTVIQPATLYGGYPNKDMLTKFFYAKPSKAYELSSEILPCGITYECFSGHSPSQVAYKTKDSIWFLGDILTPESTIEKYNISYLFNVEDQLLSLEKLKNIEGNVFIPSHGEVLTEINPTINANIKHINTILKFLENKCNTPHSIDELLKEFFDENQMEMNLSQHLLCGATFRSYITYLYNNDKVGITFNGNIMKYIKK